MKLKLFNSFIALILVCFFSKPVFSHQLNAAETSVKFNPRNKNIEIVHRFYLHDVEHLIQKNQTKVADDVRTDPYDFFVNYIRKGFAINLKPLDIGIEFLGSEADGKHFYIYQEIPKAQVKSIQKVQVNIDAMQNNWQPNYWLFAIELEQTNKIDFVLNKNKTSQIAYLEY